MNPDKGSAAESYIECNLDEIESIVQKSKSSKCYICSNAGATIVPHVSNKSDRKMMIHFPCGARNGFRMEQGDPDSDEVDYRRFAIPPPQGNICFGAFFIFAADYLLLR